MSTDEEELEERAPLPRQLSEEFADALEEEDETTKSITLFSTPDKDESGEWVPLFSSSDTTINDTIIIPTDSEHEVIEINSSSSSSGTTFTWNTYPPTPLHENAPLWRPWAWHNYDSEGQEELTSSEEELNSTDDSLAFLGDFSSDCSEVGYTNVFSTLFPNQHVKEEEEEEEEDVPLIEAPDQWLDGLDYSDHEGLPHEECGDDSVFEDPDIIPPTPKRVRHH